jgi:hypothetical protein
MSNRPLVVAMMMWEHVLVELSSDRKQSPWKAYARRRGVSMLLLAVADHVATLETAFKKAQKRNPASDFVSYVPKYMEKHVTRILT